MLGHPLISRQSADTDGLGTVLSVVKDADSLILYGNLLKPYKVKNQIITSSTIERLTWKDPIELFDSNEEGKQLIGAGKIEIEKGKANFVIKVISEKYCCDITSAINRLGFSAFERIYSVYPILKVKSKNHICCICDNPIGTEGCNHLLGKDYLRVACRGKVLSANIDSLVWSGLREFTA